MSSEIESIEYGVLRGQLLGWYDENRRELPWRAGPGEVADPYHIWVSEVMLQQTRVETVRPYFARWLERFPSLTALGDAPLDDVLKHWEGLGYYSRARNLHRAVREVVGRYKGRIPDDPAAFRALPGVGRYTAGAVMSIAFGRAEPIVDGNVRRVFARLIDEAAPSEAELWSMAERLVAGDRPGDLNQAVMELGATVCTPRAPRCDACPISAHCRALTEGTQEDRPARRSKRPLPKEHYSVAVVVHEGSALLVRRPDSGRLGGLWEFPSVRRRKGEGVRDAAVRAAVERAGVSVEVEQSLGRIEQTLTHVQLRYDVSLARVRGKAVDLDAKPSDGIAWVAPERLSRFALPRAQQRIARLAQLAPEVLPSG